MNNVSIAGRLTADPEMRTTAKGEHMCKFTVAVDRETSEKEADFIRCIVFRQSADYVCNYCGKGDVIGLTGKIRTGSYEDKDGKKVYTTDIFVDRIERLHKQQPKNDYPVSGQSVYLEDIKPGIPAGGNDAEEELPF